MSKITSHDSLAGFALRLLDHNADAFAVVANEQQATRICNVLKVLGNKSVVKLDEMKQSPFSGYLSSQTSEAIRVAKIASTVVNGPDIVVASGMAALQRFIAKDSVQNRTLKIDVNQTVAPEAFVNRLINELGYRRRPRVIEHGEVAMRGDIIDVFSGQSQLPIRIEWFDEIVESIRIYDTKSQRTVTTTDSALLVPASLWTISENTKQLLNELAGELNLPSRVAGEMVEQLVSGESGPLSAGLWPLLHDETETILSLFRDRSQFVFQLDDVISEVNNGIEREQELREIAIEKPSLVATFSDLWGRSEDLKENSWDDRSYLFPKEGIVAEKSNTRENNLFTRHVEDSTHALNQWLHDTKDIQKRLVVCETETRRKRLTGFLEAAEHNLTSTTQPLSQCESGFFITRGVFGNGFINHTKSIAVLSASDLFGADASGKVRRPSRKRKAPAPEAGQLVVHETHGVGRFNGLKMIDVSGMTAELLEVEYREGKLFLPVYRMGELTIYASAGGKAPKLDQLGGQTWAKTKKKVSQDAAELAEKLLQIYAKRAANKREPILPPEEEYDRFAARFPHQETPDQMTAISHVIGDLTGPTPMDRLICGDVGFGKTEVSMRAAFLAANAGHQVAILAPTTVLVEQHYRTFCQRLEGTGLNVRRLSRFCDKKEQTETLKAIENGKCDVVVGTHRLLSSDVKFCRLGLLVIDEEQRFGVKHKEQLKNVRSTIDVLAMSATPIPRTLHFALSGLRDLSLITTPPTQRLDVRTYVAEEQEAIIKRAVLAELARDGQVFFVVPRIQKTVGQRLSLQEWQDWLSTIPNAKVVAAHGKQSNKALENAMHSFIEGESNILVATSLVENGLDIPKANTAIIIDADKFGMSQLYQLRGRVGRGKRRAYCYLLVQSMDGLTAKGKRRMEALSRYTDLGAGFSVASADLEIRGGGDILGKKQSGAISKVGLAAFSRMLKRAVSHLQGLNAVDEVPVELKVDVASYIPADYIRDVGLRLETYHLLSAPSEDMTSEQLVDEMRDRFGPVPQEVQNLAACVPLRRKSQKIRCTHLHLQRTKMSLTLKQDAPITWADLIKLVRSSKGTWKLPGNYRIVRVFSPSEQTRPFESATDALSTILRYVT